MDIKLTLDDIKGRDDLKIEIYSALISLIKINDFKSISLIIHYHRFGVYGSFFSIFKSEWRRDVVPSLLFNSNMDVCFNINDIKVSDFVQWIDYWGSCDSVNSIGELKTYAIGVILNNLYSGLLQIQGVKIEDVIEARNSLDAYCVSINHSLYHSFYYLLIKSPLLIKFILGLKNVHDITNFDEFGELEDKNTGSRSGYGERFKSNVVSFYSQIKTMESIIIDTFNYYYDCNNPRSDGTSLSKNIDSYHFTFEHILQSNFDELLSKLVELFTLNHSDHVLDNIKYFFDIGRMDLLLIHFQTIISKFKYYQYSFTTKFLEMAFASIDSDACAQEILPFCIDERNVIYWLKQCLYSENKYIVKYLFETFKYYPNYQFWYLLFENPNINNNPSRDSVIGKNKSDTFKKNPFDLCSIDFIFSNYKHILKPETNSSPTKVNRNCIFKKSFINGDVMFCNLLLKHYPKYYKITNQLITDAVYLGNLNIIKYYYSTLIIKNQKLLSHFKSQLKPDKSITYFTWFK